MATPAQFPAVGDEVGADVVEELEGDPPEHALTVVKEISVFRVIEFSDVLIVQRTGAPFSVGVVTRDR